MANTAVINLVTIQIYMTMGSFEAMSDKIYLDTSCSSN